MKRMVSAIGRAVCAYPSADFSRKQPGYHTEQLRAKARRGRGERLACQCHPLQLSVTSAVGPCCPPDPRLLRPHLSAWGNPAAAPPPRPRRCPPLPMSWSSCWPPCWPIALSPGPGRAPGPPYLPHARHRLTRVRGVVVRSAEASGPPKPEQSGK